MIFKISFLINLIYFTFLYMTLVSYIAKFYKLIEEISLMSYLFKQRNLAQSKIIYFQFYFLTKAKKFIYAKKELINLCFKRYVTAIFIYSLLVFISVIIGFFMYINFKINYQLIINKITIPFCVLLLSIVVYSIIDLIISTRRKKIEAFRKY